LKASEILKNNKDISISSANVGRKNFCTYLKTLCDTATDMFLSNDSTLDAYDKAFLKLDAQLKELLDYPSDALPFKI
jgi:hypothetical protein